MLCGRVWFLSAILAGLGTRSAAIPTRFSNITFVSSPHHSPTATPAYSEIVAQANSLLHEVGAPSRVIPAFNPIATNWTDCHASRPIPADHKLNPTAIEQSAWKSVHESTLATGWNSSEQQSTATPKPPTLIINGSTSASTALVGLAATLLEPATDTFVHVPTPQTTSGARHGQNVDPPSLSVTLDKQSPHATLVSLYQGAGPDGRRQMSNNNDNTNDAITSSDIQPTSVMVDPMATGDRFNNLISAVGDAATRSEMATASPTDALDVLLDALPSSVASSLESQFSATATHDITSTKSHSRPTTRPDTSLTVSSTSSGTSSLSTSTSSSISSTTLSTSTRPTSSLTSTSSTSISTPAPPTNSNSNQLQTNAIAGIATGVTAGAVVIILAVVWFLRRRQQGKSPFGRHPSQRSRTSNRAYPEVAWLYDPAPTPPNEPTSPHHQRGESAASLLPQVRQPEMAAMMMGGGLAGNPYRSRSPEMGGPGADSPLLPPHMPAVRDESPGRSSPRSGSTSPRQSARSSMGSGEGRRPLHAIFEESQAQ